MVEKKKINITCLSGALGGQKRLYMNAQTPLVYYWNYYVTFRLYFDLLSANS